MSNSSTTIAYINNKRGIKSKECNKIAKGIWFWCFKNNFFISAPHIAGKHNTEANIFSRKFNINREW